MTGEEAIRWLKNIKNVGYIKNLLNHSEAIDMAIKALEQGDISDKIRADIEKLPKTYPFVNHLYMYVKEDDVKKIIDKYNAGSEPQEREDKE